MILKCFFLLKSCRFSNGFLWNAKIKIQSSKIRYLKSKNNFITWLIFPFYCAIKTHENTFLSFLRNFTHNLFISKMIKLSIINYRPRIYNNEDYTYQFCVCVYFYFEKPLVRSICLSCFKNHHHHHRHHTTTQQLRRVDECICVCVCVCSNSSCVHSSIEWVYIYVHYTDTAYKISGSEYVRWPDIL